MTRGLKLSFLAVFFSCLAGGILQSRVEEVIDVTSDPLQEQVISAPVILHLNDFKWVVTPRAHYRIAARVLTHTAYNSGWQSMISPMDLALGWGEFADRKADHWVEWSQAGRWYFYHWTPDAPFDSKQIGQHSANVHIIPANEQVRGALQYVRNNDAVLLEGDLVDVDGSRGARVYGWRTS